MSSIKRLNSKKLRSPSKKQKKKRSISTYIPKSPDIVNERLTTSAYVNIASILRSASKSTSTSPMDVEYPSKDSKRSTKINDSSSIQCTCKTDTKSLRSATKSAKTSAVDSKHSTKISSSSSIQCTCKTDTKSFKTKISDQDTKPKNQTDTKSLKTKISDQDTKPKNQTKVAGFSFGPPPPPTPTLERRQSLLGIRLPSLNSDESEKPNKPKPGLICCLKPYNQECERERFFKSGYKYNPQFCYQYPIDEETLKKHGIPSDDYIDIAIHIMKFAIKKFGNYEKYENASGGRRLTRAEILDKANRYLEEEGLEEQVAINLSEDLISRGSMTRSKGRATLNIKNDNVRINWMDGLLRHEVGTHYIRASNNKIQPWYKAKVRRRLDLLPFNPTEEGLASLHSNIFRKWPCMWRAALLYYTTFKANTMSFSDLFADLKKFVKDPLIRWDYCIRTKRGLTDTSQPGCFGKDQVYLNGCLPLLKDRKRIDFKALVQLGKVSYKDVDRIMELGDLENSKVPIFMQDEENYLAGIEHIMVSNNLNDKMLQDVKGL